MLLSVSNINMAQPVKLYLMAECESVATHYRNLNEIENGICILGFFSGLHREPCWCDLQNIDVMKEVALTCLACFLHTKLSFNKIEADYDKLPEDKKKKDVVELTFENFMNVIYEQELEHVKSGFFGIDCGLPIKQRVKCIEKFEMIYEKFMKNWRE